MGKNINEAHEKVEQQPAGIVKFALDYPYFIIVLCIMISILGGLSVKILPKDLLPISNQAAVQVITFYSGMPVQNVEEDLTQRFEQYTDQAIGIVRQESRSLTGVSIVRNIFGPGVDLNSAMSQITSLVMSVLRKLPPGTQPPLILPYDPMASSPLAMIAISGDVPEKTLRDVGRYYVGPAAQAVPGAMAPTVMGGAEREIIVYLDPKKIQHFNLSPLDVLRRLNQFNTFVPTGDTKIGNFDYQIISNGLADRIAEMNDFPLRSENGVTVRVKDVGEAKDSHAIQTNIVMVDGKREVYVPVFRQPGANSIQVVDDVKNAVKKLQNRFQDMKFKVVGDQSEFIRHAIHSIAEEAAIGGGLAALLILIFLGDLRATFAILLSIPLSLLVAFIGLKSVGETLNAMSLGGLALSIGVLVDNSIVVIEIVSRKLSEGLSPAKAALEGASEVAMPVMCSTIATMIVLFPVVFLEGVSKILFVSLAKAVCLVMIASYFIAMTVIPLYSSRFLKGHQDRRKLPLLLRLPQDFMEWLTRAYGSMLGKALKYTKTLMFGLLCLLVVGGLLAPKLGRELFPRADAGNFVMTARMASGTRIEKAEEFAKVLNAKLRKWIPPHDLSMIISNIGVIYGYPAAYTPNAGTQDMYFNVELTPNRDHTSQYYAAIIRQKMKESYPDVDIGIQLGGLLTSALNGGLPAPIDVQIEGSKLEESAKIGKSFAEQFKKLQGAVDVRVQQRFDNPQINFKVDRAKAGELGLTVDEVMKNVVSSVSGSASFSPSIWIDPKSGIDYFFGVQFKESDVSSVNDLAAIPMTGKDQMRGVPLKDIATFSESKGPTEANHVNLRPVIDVYMDAQGRDIGSLSGEVQDIINETTLPHGYTAEIRGEISEMNSAVNSLQGGFLLATVLVYLILVTQFKSFKLPAIILSSVPLGIVGIIFMLVATHTYFSIQAAIGAIFMIGITVANGVLLIEFIQHQAENAENLEEAIIRGAKARFRPILMTALASIFGLIPMAVGLGHGSEANIPLGRAVIGGQLLSTFLTFFVVPALYRVFSRKKVNANAGMDMVMHKAVKSH